MFSEAQLSEVEVFSLSQHGEDLPLADNFTLGEFACNDGTDVVLVHPSLVVLLQNIRDHFGAAVHLTNGYRTPEHNSKVGGSVFSAHIYGMGADIYVDGVPPSAVARYADDELGAGGVGRYDNFTHVDVKGFGRRWGQRS